MRTLPVLGWFCGLLACAACGPDAALEPSVRQNEAAIIGGSADTGHPAVVVLIVEQTADYFLCSGTVVSPHVVLTAAHCVNPDHVGASTVFQVYDQAVLPALTGPPVGPHYFAVTQTKWHPSYVDATATQAAAVSDASSPLFDIGVAITTEALTAAPLAMNRLALGDGSIGAAVHNVGYGRTSAADGNSDGTRTGADATLMAIFPDVLQLDGGVKAVCRGDSGGPALLVQNGQEVVAGIHSWIEHGATCTGSQFDTRVDVYAAAFVDPLIEMADPGWLVLPDAGTGDGGADAGSLEGDAGTDAGDGPPPQPTGCGCGNQGWPAWPILLALLGASRRRVRRAPG